MTDGAGPTNVMAGALGQAPGGRLDQAIHAGTLPRQMAGSGLAPGT